MSDAHEHALSPTGQPEEPSALHYLAVWLVLLGFTALTYLLSRVHLGVAALPVAITIAVVKTSLVAIFFMHVLHESGMSRLAVVIALVFVGSLAALAVADAATRFPAAVVREPDVPTHPMPAYEPPDFHSIPF